MSYSRNIASGLRWAFFAAVMCGMGIAAIVSVVRHWFAR